MSRPVRVAMAGFRMTDPTAWSGTPAGLTAGLAAHGTEVVALDSSLPRPVARALHAWMIVSGRGSGLWYRSREFFAASSAAVRIRRRLTERGPIDAWLTVGSDFGIPSGRPLVTFDDMTVVQASRFTVLPESALEPRQLRAWVNAQRRLFGAADGCCVASSWAARSLVEDYGVPVDKVHVVGLGRNLDPRPVERSWDSPVFLFVGAAWERKNGDAVVRAFAEVRDRHPGAILHLVGDAPRLAQPGVFCHGRLDQGVEAERRQLVDLFESSTAFVMPSWCEPYGIVYLEAAAAGIGSIGSTLGGASDAIGPGGVIVDPRDDDALTAAMIRMAVPAEARRLGEAARRRSSRYTWDRVAHRVMVAAGLAAPTAADTL